MADSIKNSTAQPGDSDDSRFLERVMRYLEDQLPEQGIELLREELTTDERKREAFALICISDTLAHEELPGIEAANPAIDEHPEKPEDKNLEREHLVGEAAQASNESMHETMHDTMHDTMVLPAIVESPNEPVDDAITLPTFPSKAAAPASGAWQRYALWAAGLVVALTGVLLWSFTPRTPIAATLTSSLQARWSDASAGPPVGGALRVGQVLDLESGCAALKFPNATQLVAEGPVRIKLTGPNSVELISGKISVKMLSGQSGFVVKTPDCVVTDLGTEFGVSADPSSKATDVHVFSGQVQVAAAGSNAPGRLVTVGGLAHAESGSVSVKSDASVRQLFVDDLSQSSVPLEVADLLCGGSGAEEHRGEVIDPVTGASGIWGTLDPWYDKSSALRGAGDGQFHRAASLPVVDGCFIPNGDGGLQQVDSAGHQFNCPTCSGGSSMRLCVGGSVAPLPAGKTTTPKCGDANFSISSHSYVMVCPNMGLTLNLSAIQHIHPVTHISGFRATFGCFGPSDASADAAADTPSNPSGTANFIVLVDGVQRYSKTGYTAHDGPISFEIPLTASDRYLTIITTDSGDAVNAPYLFLGDAYLIQKR
jgi:hypothetical protein